MAEIENDIKLNPNKVKKYQTSIYNFLEKYRVGNGADIKYTHISMGESHMGKFNLDKKAIKEFNNIYGEATEYGVEFHIAEKPKEFGPLLVDIDMEFPNDEYKPNSRLYNTNLVLDVINAYRESIIKYLDLNNDELQVCLIEKPKPSMKPSIVKDGFHLIFNNICASTKLRHIIRNNAVEILKNNDNMTSFANTVDKIVDKAVVSTNCWLMYGSRKKDGQLYSLTKIYDYENAELNLPDKSKYVKMFSIQQKIWDEENAHAYLEHIDDEFIEAEYKKCDKYNGAQRAQPTEFHVSENKEDEIRRATYLVSLLDDSRAKDFESWMRVGWALHNVDVSLISTWVEFSKRCSKFKNGECEKVWYKMRDEGLTIRSLMLWAEQDNYTKYHQFITSEFNDVLNKSLDGSSYFVAKALYTKYIERFVCTSLKFGQWYEFRNHRWYSVAKGYTLQKEISESFANEYYKLISKHSLKATQLNGSDREDAQKKVEKTQAIIRQLMNITFKDKVMRECETLFFDSEFEKKLDENYDLIGFNNGVYDLAQEEFREGRPDDYISQTTGNDYYEFHMNNPFSDKMFKFLREILPNEDVRKYFLLTLATCVAGHNKEEKMHLVTGSGSNGKSLLFSLVQKALGEYYLSCPITIITRKRGQSNQASPELLRLKGARCGCFQETDEGEKLNVGIMKEITGNDSFMVRGLFSDPIEIKPQIKFFLACNQKPEVPSTDGGTWRRLRVIDFNSKFVEVPAKSNEFLIDNMLKQKIQDWAPLFASYLIHLYVSEYKKLSYLSEPDAVKYSTNSYKMENDYYTEFFVDKIIITNHKRDTITIKNMWETFKSWFKVAHENHKVPNQNEFHKFIVEKIGEPRNNLKWMGYKFSENTPENDNNDNNDNSDDDNIIDNMTNKPSKNALDL